MADAPRAARPLRSANSVEEDKAELMRRAIKGVLADSFVRYTNHPSASNWTMLKGAMFAYQQTHEDTGTIPEELLVAEWLAAECNTWKFAQRLEALLPA